MKTLNLLSLPPLGARGLHTMTILLLAALSLGGCNIKDPIATPVPSADYSIIDGDTIKTVIFKDYKKLKALDPNGKNYIIVGDTVVLYKEPKLHTPPAKAPDLSKLKNNDDPDLKGKPLRMVAIGGSLTAGVRDGGYFNEGILTSYPNLIARQMKLQKFEQPLFDATDYNGFGRKVRTSFNPTGGPVPKFNTTKNNGENIIVDDPKFKKYKGQLENFGVPFMRSGSLLGTNSNVDFAIKTYNSSKIEGELIKRVLPDNIEYFQYISSQKFDFFTLEFGIDNLINFAKSGGDVRNYPSSAVGSSSIDNPYGNNYDWLSAEVKLLLKFSEKKIKKGCLLNIPDILNLPFFDITKGKTASIASQFVGLKYYHNDRIRDVSPSFLLLPSSAIDSLMSAKVHISLKKGVLGNKPLSKSDLLDEYDLKEIETRFNQYNQQLELLSKKHGFPIVDIKILYKSITEGAFITEEGIKVNKSNFFSSDGINPTPFGQAVIANEVIKTLNGFYKMDTPLINTKEYLR